MLLLALTDKGCCDCYSLVCGALIRIKLAVQLVNVQCVPHEMHRCSNAATLLTDSVVKDDRSSTTA